MIGIDITNKQRFKNKSEAFVKKILHNEEFLKYCLLNAEEEKLNFIATRWAIKEALFKCDNSFFNFNKINLKYNERKYFIENFENQFFITTSNEENIVVAVVMKVKE
ncbi:4'-phosphopantetheinyl transferase superfamily protein [Mycoplasma sp. 1654_15]|uniref:4'-phosphopantetheinyl transferase superfamily protein n=1 Tax=Mycoplasma sp. 1654_15 TaxID=2725994 RepID=UPI0014498B5C|nr:4'-phosphopantetheinyl transferase superfamily protein [Mycoplasma sp. 1654_15]QJB71188.1 4'-phosphopantetheinyl transferase superfamily protein [Mycoplasma sp. 1654_15]